MRNPCLICRCLPALALAFATSLLLPAAGCSDENDGPKASADGGAQGNNPDGPYDPGATGPLDTVDLSDPDNSATTNPCQGCLPEQVCIVDECVTPEEGGCEPGVVSGCASDNSQSVCDASGTAFVASPCPAANGCFDGVCKPVLCQPGTTVCEGLSQKKQCTEDGTGFLTPEDCPDGLYCSAGKCTSTCELDVKFGASVGCIFWTVDLPNYPDPSLNPTPEDLPHGVVISNPGEKDATVSFEPPPGVIVENPDPVVPAQQSRVFLMPVLNIKGTGVSHGGIRIVSTRPVLAHQFNPWDNQFSNDASLLIPETYLGSSYVVLTWPTTPLGLLNSENCADTDGDGACDCEDGQCGAFDPIFCPSDCGDGAGLPGMGDLESQHGYFSVLAPYDDTTVTLQITAAILGSDKVQATGSMGGLQQVVLQAGEVLNIEADPTSFGESGDLSGSTVSADKPVAVFVGHEEAAFGEPATQNPLGEDMSGGACCADHLEEQLFPISMLGQSYLAVKSSPRGSEPDVWRVQAAEAGVTLSTTPSIPGLDGVTLDTKGDWVEAHTSTSFQVEGTGRIQVAQYLVSQEATEDMIGDPSQIQAVPVELYRDQYAIMVPSDYSENWVTVIKPAGSSVNQGPAPVPQDAFTAFGDSAWEFAYVVVTPGVHIFTGDANFGLVAYGYNNAVSYGYPGGMSIGDGQN